MPTYRSEFKEIDGSPGWYAGASIDAAGYGRLPVFRYDNGVDPSAKHNNAYAWQARFWDAGSSSEIGPFHVIAEGLAGDMRVNPDRDGPFKTDFHTIYFLGGWTRGAWGAALQLEPFGTIGFNAKHGHAVTAALHRQARDWVRLTAEVVATGSTSRARAAAPLDGHTTDVEPELVLQRSF